MKKNNNFNNNKPKARNKKPRTDKPVVKSFKKVFDNFEDGIRELQVMYPLFNEILHFFSYFSLFWIRCRHVSQKSPGSDLFVMIYIDHKDSSSAYLYSHRHGSIVYHSSTGNIWHVHSQFLVLSAFLLDQSDHFFYFFILYTDHQSGISFFQEATGGRQSGHTVMVLV